MCIQRMHTPLRSIRWIRATGHEKYQGNRIQCKVDDDYQYCYHAASAVLTLLCMRGENAWKIEKCYMLKDDYDKLLKDLEPYTKPPRERDER